MGEGGGGGEDSSDGGRLGGMGLWVGKKRGLRKERSWGVGGV